MSKILENSYRATNIAFIDEWTNYAEAVGINLNKIIKLLKKKNTQQHDEARSWCWRILSD